MPSGAKGIDVSHWSLVENFKEIPADVVMFGAKATEGNSISDEAFLYHRDGARARGFTLTKYFHVARPGDPVAHAQRLAVTVGPLLPGECLVLDTERGSGVDIAYVEGFYAELDRLGMSTSHDLYYGSLGVWRMMGNPPWPRAAAGKVGLWAPRYKSGSIQPNLPPPWSGWALWQWTDGGKTGDPYVCPGVGPCDASVFAGDQAALEAFVAPTAA